MQPIFEPLLCINRIEETVNSATFEFTKLDNSLFEYKAGQFLTLEVDVAGELEYRAYSFSSTPSQPKSVSITVKRMEEGKVSNHLLDHLQAGIALPAMFPTGEFTIQDNRVTQDIVLISAGSGIAPCISITRWLLDTKPEVNINFIHTARSENDVIMAEVLATLDKQYDNFQLSRIVKNTNNKNDIPGKINAAIFATLIPEPQGKTLFICGPDSYMEMIESFAEAAGFDMEFVHKESFTPATDDPVDHDAVSNYQIVTPQYDKSFEITEDQTLLAALEIAKVPISAACRSGMCGACRCKVTGKVESTSQATLTAEEIDEGYVLSCSTKALSDLVVEL